MSVAMITAEEIMKWSPHAKPEYVKALLRGEGVLRDADILNSKLTLAHFMAQVGAETAGLTILRESMLYKSVDRIRDVWPARAKKHTDAWINMNLVGKPVALAQWAYAGRMGNAPAPSTDAYDYRGGGFFQTTGKSAVAKYCKRCNILLSADVLDNYDATLRFACYEWKDSGCGAYAESNDLLSVSRIINTGSATSGVMPNGMEHRKNWLKKSWSVWGDRRETIPEVTDLTLNDLRRKGSETVSMTDVLKTGSAAGAAVSAVTGVAKESGVTDVAPSLPSTDVVDALRGLTESTDVATTAIRSLQGFIELTLTNMWVFGLAFGVGGYVLARWIANRRLTDARLGFNTARVSTQSSQDDAGPVGVPG